MCLSILCLGSMVWRSSCLTQVPGNAPRSAHDQITRSNLKKNARFGRSFVVERRSRRRYLGDVGVGLFSRLLLRKAAPMQTELDTETCLILTGLRNSVGARFEEPRWKLFLWQAEKKVPCNLFLWKRFIAQSPTGYISIMMSSIKSFWTDLKNVLLALDGVRA